jgi:hypothetical protein
LIVQPGYKITVELKGGWVRTGYQQRILKNQVKDNPWRCSILHFKVIYDKKHNLNPARLNSCSSCGELLPTPAGLCPFTFSVLGFNHPQISWGLRLRHCSYSSRWESELGTVDDFSKRNRSLFTLRASRQSRRP